MLTAEYRKPLPGEQFYRLHGKIFHFMENGIIVLPKRRLDSAVHSDCVSRAQEGHIHIIIQPTKLCNKNTNSNNNKVVLITCSAARARSSFIVSSGEEG